jgi:hypothetical protein
MVDGKPGVDTRLSCDRNACGATALRRKTRRPGNGPKEKRALQSIPATRLGYMLERRVFQIIVRGALIVVDAGNRDEALHMHGGRGFDYGAHHGAEGLFQFGARSADGAAALKMGIF